MEQPEELLHGCPACAGDSESTENTEKTDSSATPPGWSRRSMLQIGLAAGVGAAGVTFSPALASALGGAQPLGVTSFSQQLTWPPPPIVTRAQWGCNEALRKPGQSYDSVVEKIVVHHTVTPNNPSDPAAVVRSVYEYNVSGVYIDIAYHFLIDQFGRVYEGRWARDYPSGAPHIGENASRQSIQAAATLGHNPRTIAIAMLGTFTDILPTPAAMSSLDTVLAWKCARWGIDPLASTPYRNSDGGVEVFPDILPHRAVVPTICPGDPIIARLSSIRGEVSTRLRSGLFGYWIARADGSTQAFGDLPDVGDTRRLGLTNTIQAIEAHPSGLGYWALGTDGGVFTFGPAQFFGSMGGTRLNQPVIGMATTRTGKGYWLLARDGGIFSFGDARFFGSTGAIRLNQPIIAMCATATGNGYWLLARDGGVFCFGDARFLGSGPGRGLRASAVAIAATSTGHGYAILASNGQVLPFGDAQSYGNATGPVVGFAALLRPKG
jgi:N-acetylmuramoyl-L-alanine amidase